MFSIILLFLTTTISFNSQAQHITHPEIHEAPFHYGHQHRRPTMEDAHIETNFSINQQPFTFFAIYDGHGGKMAAEFCAQDMPAQIQTCLNAHESIETALHTAFLNTDAALIQKGITDGCTAITALIDTAHNNIYLAHVADARGLVCDASGKIVIATLDHTLNPKATDCPAVHALTQAERQRVEKWGGKMINIWGNRRFTVPTSDYALPFTRAMGDAAFKPYGMSAEPTIISCIIPTGGLLILACDGVWDVLSNEQAAHIALEARLNGKNEAQTAQTVVESAMWAGSTDNISVSILYF